MIELVVYADVQKYQCYKRDEAWNTDKDDNDNDGNEYDDAVKDHNHVDDVDTFKTNKRLLTSLKILYVQEVLLDFLCIGCWISQKSCPFLWKYFLNENGQDFYDTQYAVKLENTSYTYSTAESTDCHCLK